MLQPQKTKFRKQHKGRIHGKANSGAKLNFGSFGLKAKNPGRINSRQIEAARRAITREMQREGRVWIRIMMTISPIATVASWRPSLRRIVLKPTSNFKRKIIFSI